MRIHCSSCGAGIDVFANFCPMCGVEAPRRTIGPDAVREEIVTDFCFCASCSERNSLEFQFCSACGVRLFQRPAVRVLFCPRCRAKNAPAANYCCECSQSIADWFATKGIVAETIGHRGPLLIHEKLTDTFYQLVVGDVFTVGRDPDNTLSIPCKLLSGRHCLFDLRHGKLIDPGSTNGTFINRKPDRVTSVGLDDIDELNMAGTFTFSVSRAGGIFGIRLTAILEDEACARCTHRSACQELRKRYLLFVLGDGVLQIRKQDGKIVADQRHPVYVLTLEKGFSYWSDAEKGIERQLIRKAGNVLPSYLALTL